MLLRYLDTISKHCASISDYVLIDIGVLLPRLLYGSSCSVLDTESSVYYSLRIKRSMTPPVYGGVTGVPPAAGAAGPAAGAAKPATAGAADSSPSNDMLYRALLAGGAETTD